MRMFRSTISLATLTLLLAAPVYVAAETVLRVGESVRVAADQRVEEDFYAAGGTVAVSGEIVGDMYAVGGSVTANGAIAEDLTAVGGSIQVHAPVSDDVRILGGDVTIAEAVTGDLFVIAGSLTVLSSASVEGDIFFYGGEATIAGPVGGSIMGAAERFRIDAAVEGNVDVNSSRALVLGDRASVSGDVQYQSFGEITRAQNAVVEGEIIRSESTERSDPGYGKALAFFIMNLFATLCVYLLFRRELTELVAGTIRNYGRSGVLGLGTFFVAPVVVVLLMVTVLGLLLGLIGLFALLATYLIAFALTAVLAGGMISFFVTKRIQVDLLWILAGVLAVHIALLIPFLGPLLVFVGFVLMLGGMVWRLYRFAR